MSWPSVFIVVGAPPESTKNQWVATTLALPRQRERDGLFREALRPTLCSVHKSRLGARPPRKRSAPVADKWIRTDETPLSAGFRISGWLSWWWTRCCATERVPE